MKTFRYLLIVCLSVVGGFLLATVLSALFAGQSLHEAWQASLAIPWQKSVGVPLWALATCGLGICLHCIVHEAGHLVFGLASGYRFLSFRVFQYTFLKEQGHWRVKKFSVSGTLGQCLLTPPEVPAEQLPVVAYNLGGVAFNALLCAVCAAPLFVLRGMPWLNVALAMGVLSGAFLIVLNGVPMCLGGIPNDGKNALHLRRNLRSKAAFAHLLTANALVQNGTRPRDLPDALFEDAEDADPREPLQLNLLGALASVKLDRGEWDEAADLNRRIVDSGTPAAMLVLEARFELVSLLLLQGKKAEAESLLDERLLQTARMQTSMTSKRRFLLLVALHIDGDRDAAAEILKRTLAERDGFVMQGEAAMDLDLMQGAMNG